MSTGPSAGVPTDSSAGGRPAPELVVSADADALAAAVTDRLLAVVVAAQQARGEASVLVTGGRVMKRVLSTLATSGAGDAIDWPHVDIWWGDERFVGAGTSDRNDIELDDVVSAVPLDPARVHRMPATGDAATPEEGAVAYAAQLASSAARRGDPDGVPRFDVALLGVGEDGHCASLFPGAPATHVDDVTVVAVHDSPKPPPDRLSLTFRALDAAEQVWFVTAGEGKADAVAMAWAPGATRVQVPSSGPRGRQATLWLVDRDAAAKLPG